MSTLMDELHVLTTTCYVLCACGVFTFATLLFTSLRAEYGRYNASAATSWVTRVLPSVPAKTAWVVQEAPSMVACMYCYVMRDRDLFDRSVARQLLLLLFFVHYVNRTLIFPFRLRGGKATPLHLCALAFAFCAVNGYLQARFLTTSFASYPPHFHSHPHFFVGVALFAIGMLINVSSDNILLGLRRPGETGYKIPRGGAFEYVSGANFFGEIVEWTGFALAAWNLPAATFAFFTFCNIGPRAHTHHQWYLAKFEDYPTDRKALIPFVW